MNEGHASNRRSEACQLGEGLAFAACRPIGSISMLAQSSVSLSVAYLQLRETQRSKLQGSQPTTSFRAHASHRDLEQVHPAMYATTVLCFLGSCNCTTSFRACYLVGFEVFGSLRCPCFESKPRSVHELASSFVPRTSFCSLSFFPLLLLFKDVSLAELGLVAK